MFERTRIPRLFAPCLPSKAIKVPAGDGWVHEIKHDGYRLICQREQDRVRLLTKSGYDWSKKYPLIVQGLLRLKVGSLVLDGEAVVCDPDGRANFEKLHAQVFNEAAQLYAFDLLHVDGIDLRDNPLEERKRQLSKILRRNRVIQYVEHIEGDGEIIFKHVCKLGLEGIVSKRKQAAYRAGRSKMWVKVKNQKHPAIMRVKEAQWRR